MPRLFLADDNLTTQRVFQVALEPEGFEVRCFSSGEQLLTALREDSVDLLAINASLSDCDGYELCQTIKSTAETASLPIILLVGAFHVFDEARARHARCDGFLMKPFEPSALTSLVRRVQVAGTRGPVPGEDDDEPVPGPATVFEIPIETVEPRTVFLLNGGQYQPRVKGLQRECSVPRRSSPDSPSPSIHSPDRSVPTRTLSPEELDRLVEALLERLPDELRRIMPELRRP